MRSMRIDCDGPVRIAHAGTSCMAYMDGSAGTVGRIMAALLGLPPRHHADLGRLGVAFQLANFIRDVREDRRLDRIYLPAEDRDRFGVSEARPRDRHASPAVRALLAHEVERARGAVRGGPAGDRGRAGFGAPGRAARGRPLRPHARPRRGDGFDSRPTPACASGIVPGRGARGRCGERAATLRGAERTPLERRAPTS